MDRVIENRRGIGMRRALVSLVILLALAALYATVSHLSVARFEVDRERLLIATVERGSLAGNTRAAEAVVGDEEILLLRKGAFFEHTGGHWVFLIDETDAKAVRQAVRFGRQDADHHEVLSGLEAGDRVITSSYQQFGDVEHLLFKP